MTDTEPEPWEDPLLDCEDALIRCKRAATDKAKYRHLAQAEDALRTLTAIVAGIRADVGQTAKVAA